MVQSDAPDADAYLAEVEDEARREALTRIRELCRAELKGFDEVMAYGMPGYVRKANGSQEIAFANQKQYIAFYLMRTDVREAFEERLAGQNMGKGCLRFRSAKNVDFELVRDLLRATAKSQGQVC
ncbi:iron chaperone [Streptomyces sp. NPDC050418]|uniref:iron chaperone n=1 Tax=Streptomyces sp. NPDC050418 TaxID=3365612 RepID=UPI00379A6ED5